MEISKYTQIPNIEKWSVLSSIRKNVFPLKTALKFKEDNIYNYPEGS